MAGRGEEVEAAVHTGVWDATLTLEGLFFIKVLLHLVDDVLLDGLPAAGVVNFISKARRVDDAELKTKTLFFDHVHCGMDFDGFHDGLFGDHPAKGVFGVTADLRHKQGVDHS